MLNWPIWWINRVSLSLSLIGLKDSKSRKSFPRCVLGFTFSGVKEQKKIGLKKELRIPNSFTRWLVAEENTLPFIASKRMMGSMPSLLQSKMPYFGSTLAFITKIIRPDLFFEGVVYDSIRPGMRSVT